MYIFFTGNESKISGIPFLLDSDLRPITAPNQWFRKLAINGATASPNTWRTYGYALFDFFNYLETVDVNWTELTNDILYDYREIQAANHSNHTKKYLNKRTIHSRIIAVGLFYKFAHENNYIKQNNLIYKTLPYRIPRDSDMYAHLNRTFERTIPAVAFERLPKSKIKWCKYEDVIKWTNSISVWRNKIIAKLMFQTGLRRAEVTMLKISQLPEVEQIDLNFHEVKFLIVGKGNKRREVFISTRLFLEIRDYVLIERKTLLRKKKKSHSFLFVTSAGEPLKPNSLNQIFESISGKIGIKITPHKLRHSFAVHFLNHLNKIGHSQPLKTLQNRLGHSNISTTLIYTHISDEDMAQESIANAMFFEMLMEDSDEKIQ